jgi:hypothetical protein
MRNLFSSTRRTVLALTFLLLASAASAAQAACSCTAMTVHHAGTMKICSSPATPTNATAATLSRKPSPVIRV